MDDARDAIVQPGPHNQGQNQAQSQAQNPAPNEAGARPPDGARLIEVSPMGGLGNRMIQFLAAVALAARVPGARLAKIHLPEWGIQIPPAEGTYRTEVVTWPPLALDRLAHALNTGALDRVDIRTYAQRMENFLPPEAYRATFTGPQVRGAGAGELLCNIRQGDIVDARHPDYVLLPIDFYADLVAKTGLSPVFIGQLDETPYLAALRRRFPAARFIPSQGAVADFAFIRASCHIVPAVSTFSWLAAWLSEAQSVHMPVVGLFHPRQAPATQLLPIGDARYHFSLFPFHYAVPVERATAAHATIRRLWREVPHAQLAAILSRTSPARDRAGECGRLRRGRLPRALHRCGRGDCGRGDAERAASFRALRVHRGAQRAGAGSRLVLRELPHRRA
jgi:hypothetical protein